MLIDFMRRDFLEANIHVVDKTAACTEKPHLMLLSIRLEICSNESKAPTNEEETTNRLNISRVLQCTGHLSPGETFQFCFDYTSKVVSLCPTTIPPGQVPPSHTLNIGEELLVSIPAALLVLLLVAIVLAVLVTKGKALSVRLARIMYTIVW